MFLFKRPGSSSKTLAILWLRCRPKSRILGTPPLGDGAWASYDLQAQKGGHQMMPDSMDFLMGRFSVSKEEAFKFSQLLRSCRSLGFSFSLDSPSSCRHRDTLNNARLQLVLNRNPGPPAPALLTRRCLHWGFQLIRFAAQAPESTGPCLQSRALGSLVLKTTNRTRDSDSQHEPEALPTLTTSSAC